MTVASFAMFASVMGEGDADDGPRMATQADIDAFLG